MFLLLTLISNFLDNLHRRSSTGNSDRSTCFRHLNALLRRFLVLLKLFFLIENTDWVGEICLQYSVSLMTEIRDSFFECFVILSSGSVQIEVFCVVNQTFLHREYVGPELELSTEWTKKVLKSEGGLANREGYRRVRTNVFVAVVQVNSH